MITMLSAMHFYVNCPQVTNMIKLLFLIISIQILSFIGGYKHYNTVL